MGIEMDRLLSRGTDKSRANLRREGKELEELQLSRQT